MSDLKVNKLFSKQFAPGCPTPQNGSVSFSGHQAVDLLRFGQPFDSDSTCKVLPSQQISQQEAEVPLGPSTERGPVPER